MLQAAFLGWQVRIECPDPALAPFVEVLYGEFRRNAASDAQPDRFVLAPSDDGRWLGQGPSEMVTVPQATDVLAWLDDALTIGVQHHRQDLFFLHAAALVRDGRAVLLIAESGGGKSTTTWAALHHGFALLSDELAPVDPDSLVVEPFPRAICLKAIGRAHV